MKRLQLFISNLLTAFGYFLSEHLAKLNWGFFLFRTAVRKKVS